MKVKLYRDIGLKNGKTLLKGTSVDVHPTKSDTVCQVTTTEYDTYRIRYTAVIKPPSIKCLMRQEYDGIVETPYGCRVEPDGHDEKGFPSWLLVLGVI
jgi:hypothetical protein